MSMQELIESALSDARHSWSVGTFGAIGEFRWDDDEAADAGPLHRVTARGGIKVTPREDARIIAYDTLAKDGETWGQSVSICLELTGEQAGGGVVRAMGSDRDALRPQDRTAQLFDLGIGIGHVQMCARTEDAGLIAALEAIEGKSLLDPQNGGVMGEVLRAQPHRVMLSPVARLEVYTLIPPPGGESPVGPHSHLMPKLIASGRTHGANAPIPDGYQPVLGLHPRSPWRDDLGNRTPYDATLDQSFESLLARHALSSDREVRRSIEEAVDTGTDPADFTPPESRRGRTQMRIVLRRLALKDPGRVASWRAAFDRASDDEPEVEAEQ